MALGWAAVLARSTPAACGHAARPLPGKAEAMNPNDPRVKRTRQLLQQALMDLLREKGFQAITVQDIAERATLNRATFYAHFTDKYDLIDNVMREIGLPLGLGDVQCAAIYEDWSGLSVVWRTENRRLNRGQPALGRLA